MSAMRYLSGVVTLELFVEKCIGCGLCLEVCPHEVFELADKKARIADLDACMECGACAKNCPVDALAVEAGVGCAEAIVRGAVTGSEPSCECCCGEKKDESDCC